MDWTFVIALYGAAMATAAIVIEAVRFLRESRNKVIVVLKPSQVVELMSGTSIVAMTSIVNDSSVPKYITRPWFEINKANDGYKFALIADQWANEKYPKKLEVGESFESYVTIKFLLSRVEPKGASRIRTITNLTTGEAFKSKWIELSTLKDYLQEHEK